MVIVPTSADRLIVCEEFDGVSPAELFRYWIEPELLCSWWPAVATVEPVVGGVYRLEWPKIGMTLYGSVLALSPGEHFAFSWTWTAECEWLPLRVDIWFAATETGTKIGVEHGPFGPDDAKDRADILDGWTHFLGKLQAASIKAA